MAYDGFLNLLKPPGMTSHDVVALARRRLAVRRVGHLGTLDPAAAGVLPVAVGRATRLVSIIGETDKAYRALIIFGITTDTLDGEGRVTAVADASRLTEGQLREFLVGMTGVVEQIPPAYSAAQVGGKRLHELARQGIAATARAKRVRLDRLDLIEFTAGVIATALLDVTCSAGTYIRTLAEDLGRAAGCGAYLGFLLRTRAGRFRLEESAMLEEFAADPVAKLLLPADWPLSELPRVEVDCSAAVAFVGGRPVPCSADPAARVRVYTAGKLLGLGEVLSSGLLQPRLVVVTPEEVGACA